MAALELVKKDASERTEKPSGIVALGPFIAVFVAMIALASLLMLAFVVADLRDKNTLLDLKVQKLQSDVSYLRGQIDARNNKETKP